VSVWGGGVGECVCEWEGKSRERNREIGSERC
jgi:hypothetical protein